jgi:hypothetical protein
MVELLVVVAVAGATAAAWALGVPLTAFETGVTNGAALLNSDVRPENTEESPALAAGAAATGVVSVPSKSNKSVLSIN